MRLHRLVQAGQGMRQRVWRHLRLIRHVLHLEQQQQQQQQVRDLPSLLKTGLTKQIFILFPAWTYKPLPTLFPPPTRKRPSTCSTRQSCPTLLPKIATLRSRRQGEFHSVSARSPPLAPNPHAPNPLLRSIIAGGKLLQVASDHLAPDDRAKVCNLLHERIR